MLLAWRAVVFATVLKRIYMDIKSISELIAEDFAATDALIHHRLHSDVVLINQLSQHIIHSGGKRLRPLLLLLMSKALGYQGQNHHLLAVVVEFIHTATLLHDDVVDESELRRGKKTANALFGNAPSVLVGDFLYSRAFQMMVEVGNVEILAILADATNTIAAGEVMQLLHCFEPDIDQERYFAVIDAKTAKLFEAACAIAAVLAHSPAAIRDELAAFGRELGLIFQLVDDILDYTGDSTHLGKNVGDDLADGKITLPLIFARQAASVSEKNLLDQAIREGKSEALPDILTIIQKTGAVEKSYAEAEAILQRALLRLAILPDSPYRQALIALTESSLKRQA
jgi:octaprenyl-diphosphate synthase